MKTHILWANGLTYCGRPATGSESIPDARQPGNASVDWCKVCKRASAPSPYGDSPYPRTW